MPHAIHITTIKRMLQSPEPVGLKLWTRSGEIQCLHRCISLRYDFYKGTRRMKLLDSNVFKPNSYFENAVNLYEFDRDLRELIFTAIQAIEIALRSTLLSNHPNVDIAAMGFPHNWQNQPLWR